MTADQRARGIEADTDARRRAQSVYGEPVVVEAGAGTGKTSILVARIVVWSLGEGWERAATRLVADVEGAVGGQVPLEKVAAEVLGRVAAITFTEAASAEMAHRTGSMLAEVERGAIPVGVFEEFLPADLEIRATRSRLLIGALDHLVVRTIHAFCRGLLAQYPLEARIHPGFQVDADGSVQAEVVREAVEAAAVRAYSEPGDPDWIELAVDGFGPAGIEDALMQLVEAGASPDAFADDPFTPERIRAFLDDFDAGCAEFARVNRGRLEQIKGGRVPAETVAAITRTQVLLERGVAETVDGLTGFLEQARDCWPDSPLGRIKAWSQGKFNKGETGALDGETEAIAACAVNLAGPVTRSFDLDPERLQSARRVLQPLMVEVFEEMRRRGAASYDSLLRGARDLLVDSPGVARRVRADFDQLLVDEFQDTDPLQCELVRRLALEGETQARPGLFLVGDPKQSIYGWRRADLGAYDEFTREILGDREPDRLSLNFRSLPEILVEVERAIEPVMKREKAMQPAFQPLFAHRKQPSEAVRSVEHWVSWEWNLETATPERPKAGRAAALEAAAIARDLLDRHARGELEWSDVGILFRSSGDLDSYLQALRAADIPYAVERDRGFYRRREIIDASAWVRCIIDPNDQLALLAVLRSSVVGLPDAALLPLWKCGFPRFATELHDVGVADWGELDEVIASARAAWPEGVPAEAQSASWDVSLRLAMRTLVVLRTSFEEDVADVFVEKLRRLSLLEATEAARYLGAYRVANLDRFFRDLIGELETTGDPNLLLRRLRRDVADRQDAEEARPGGFENAVRVMTIHKAKGLQFRHTYLVQLHKESRASGRGGEKAELEFVEGHSEYRVFGAQSLGFHAIASQRARVEAAERVRSLYVAMTRAEDRLVLLGNWSESPARKTTAAAKSYLDLLASRETGLPDLVAGMTRAAADEREEGCEVAGVRWCFPALRQASGVIASRSTAAREAPDASRLRAEAEGLRARRAAAARRAARPWSSAASADSHSNARETQAARRFADPASESAAGLAGASRAAAKAAGTAVHRILEDFDFAAELVPELERQRRRLPVLAAALAGPSECEDVVTRAESVLGELAQGGLLAKLGALRDHIVARELPVLLPAADAAGEADDATGAVAFVAGSIDLCYRDPESGEWVVADYKTDRIECDADFADRIARYKEQGRAYQRALRDALGLDIEPRFELWFLTADRVEVVA
ncbi:MAG: UvrD-helicase domain-containing protein [Deltaproteobacteria bacterium]|nr:UvrD-helicase domain-containing protein [Deltaproteobacteria bacterium]